MNQNDLREMLTHAGVLAALRVIREGESSQDDSAYTLINGGHHFTTFDAHPFDGIATTEGGRAAGAYQFLGTTWKTLRLQYGFNDFSPASQDLGAVALMAEDGAIPDLERGDLASAITKLRGTWTSLPGARQNNPSFTLAKAEQIFEQYGGTQTEEASVASSSEPSSQSPSILDALGPIAAIFNPIAGAIISAFTPLAKEKIAKEINRHTNDPTVGQQIADSVIQAAQQATQKSDPIDAAAAVRQDPVALQQVEADTVAKINEMAPMLDKLAAYEQAGWASEESSRDAAAARAKNDAYDMSPLLSHAAIALVGVLLFLLVIVMAVQAWLLPDHEPSTAMMTLFGPLAGIVFGEFKTLYSYRYGTTRSSNAKDVILGQLASGSK